MKKLLLIIPVIAIGIFMLASPTLAATWTVTSTAYTNDSTCDGDCTILDAIEAAKADEKDSIINFDLTYPATINVTDDYSISFDNANNNVVVNGPGAENLIIDGTVGATDTNGIDVYGNNVSVSGMTIQNFDRHGILLIGDDSVNNTVSDIIIKDNSWCGIQVYHSPGSHTIFNNTISGSGWDQIWLDPGSGQIASNNIIEDNTITGGAYNGIKIDELSVGNTVSGNTITENTQNGINIEGDDNIINDNTISESGDEGIDLRGINNTVTGNEIYRPSGFGIYMSSDADYNTVSNNTIDEVGFYEGYLADMENYIYDESSYTVVDYFNFDEDSYTFISEDNTLLSDFDDTKNINIALGSMFSGSYTVAAYYQGEATEQEISDMFDNIFGNLGDVSVDVMEDDAFIFTGEGQDYVWNNPTGITIYQGYYSGFFPIKYEDINYSDYISVLTDGIYMLEEIGDIGAIGNLDGLEDLIVVAYQDTDRGTYETIYGLASTFLGMGSANDCESFETMMTNFGTHAVCSSFGATVWEADGVGNDYIWNPDNGFSLADDDDYGIPYMTYIAGEDPVIEFDSAQDNSYQGIKIEGSNNLLEGNTISNSGSAAIMFAANHVIGEGINNIARDNIFEDNEVDFTMHNMNSASDSNDIINYIYDEEKIQFNDEGYLNFYYTTRALIQDQDENYLSAVEVSFVNVDEVEQASLETGIDGYTDYQTLYAYSYDSEGLKETFNPYTITATYDEEIQSQEVEINEPNQLVEFEFEIITEAPTLGIILTPADMGGPNVRVVDVEGNQISSFMAYQSNLRGEFKAIQADIDGDGVNEIITTTGVGFGPNVRAFELDGTLIDWFMAFDENFRGGINITAGDFDNDGDSEIAVAPMSMGGPNVRLYELNNGEFELVDWFMAYQEEFMGGVNLATQSVADASDLLVTSPASNGGSNIRLYELDNEEFELVDWFMAYQEEFMGGVELATADVTGDGLDEIITMPAAAGGPNMRVYELNEEVEVELLDWAFVYDENLRTGYNVTAGDIDGDGSEEIIVAPKSDGGPNVRVYSYDTSLELVDWFMAYDESFWGGVSLSTQDIDNDGFAEILTGPSTGTPNVRVYDVDSGEAELNTWFWGFAETFTGGVNII